MTSPSAPSSPWETPTYPRVCAGVPRPETLTLFGCWLADVRMSAELETPDMARLAGRSSEWIASIEAGRCIPTPAGFQDLREALKSPKFATSPQTERDPARVAQALELDPWGDQASRLRAKFGLQPRNSTALDNQPDDGTLLPLLQEVQHRDRLLALTPLLGLAAIVGLFWAGTPWRAEPEFRWPDFDAIAFLGLLALTALSILLPSVGRAMDIAIRPLRTGRVRKYYRAAHGIRVDEQVPLPLNGGWWQPGEQSYLLPSLSDRCRSLAVEADVTERLLLVALTASAAIAYATRAAIKDGGSLSDHWVWVATGAATLLLSIRSWWRLRTLAKAAADCLNDAYGEPSDSPSEA